MEQPNDSRPRSSGIPRLSKIPVPRGLEKPQIPSNNDSSRYSVKSLRTPRKAHQATSITEAFAEAELEAPAHTPSISNKPPNRANSEANQQVEPFAIAELEARPVTRRPRPSLSDRTIETLSQIPPSPSPRRRRSSFFPQESPSISTSRPGSSLSRSRPVTSYSQYPPLPSGSSRPGTSHGQHPPLPSGHTSRPASPAKRHLAPTTGNQNFSGTPTRRSISSYHPKAVHNSKKTPHGDEKSAPPTAKSPSILNISDAQELEDPTTFMPSLKPFRGSKTLAARPSRLRPTAQSVFIKPAGKDPSPTELPERPDVDPPPISVLSSEATHPLSPHSKRSSQTSSGSGQPSALLITDKSEVSSLSSPPSKRSSRTSSGAGKPPGVTTVEILRKSNASTALRETIAKAKAAHQKAIKAEKQGIKDVKRKVEAFPDFEIGDAASILRDRVVTARTSGKLNIAALALKRMPSEVMNMYGNNAGGGAWYECVDLLRLNAADNDFEELDDSNFPDQTAEPDEPEDDFQGSIFSTLESLDLHGNRLQMLPLGFRKLQCLTTLNLSKNRLENSSLPIVFQLHSLRELRLADNAFNGTLENGLCALEKLQVLDVHNNMISALPENLNQLVNINAIDISGNRLGKLPFECLSTLPLSELNASRNRLSGVLFDGSLHSLVRLKSLDVSHNVLTSVTPNAIIELPSLQDINLTENRLTSLPDISGWMECLSLIAGGNQLSSFPVGITSLPLLKAVDFSRNDIRRLDERLGFMDSLTILRVANNPLRERKFLYMDTDEIKRELKGRVLPENTTDLGVRAPKPAAYGCTEGSAEIPKMSKIWPVKPGGILDRSATKLESVDMADLEPVMDNADVKSLILSRNKLQEIPQAINALGGALKMLDLSHNKLAGTTFLSTILSLPNLRSLNLSSNGISGLSSLVDFLDAPILAELVISRNRLGFLLPLRTRFPSLVSLDAADNSICELEVETIKGLQVLDVSGNEITHLEPRLGLLDEEGLRTLVVGGNRFRVPRRDVIDKGTEALLAWLKSRIPEGEM